MKGDDKLKIYKVGIEFTYDEIKKRVLLKDKIKLKDYKEENCFVPILATNKEEAIDKYRQIYYDIKKQDIPTSIWYTHEVVNVRTEIIVYEYGHHTLSYLQKKMHSDDFIEYCKQSMGLSEQVENILNIEKSV